MIYGLVGKPGGGKSYEAVVYHIIPALKSGRKVITNLPLNIDALVSVYGEKVRDLIEIRTHSVGYPKVKGKSDLLPSQQKGKSFSSIECFSDDWRDDNGRAPLLVLDECHMVLGRGRTALEISEWFSMHRHLGFDLLLITQNFRKVDNDICDMIELIYYVSKNTMLGNAKTYTKKVKDGLRGDVVNTEQRAYEKKYFRFYQSHTKSNKSITEAYANDVKGMYSHWTFKGSVILLSLALVLIFYNIFKSDKKPIVQRPSVPSASERDVIKEDIRNNLKNSIVSRSSKNNELSQDDNQNEKHSSIVRRSKESVNDTVDVVKSLNQPLQTHPFYKITLHIKGRYTVGDINGFVFAAAQNGQHVFDMKLRDLYMAGYDVSVLGDCNIELSYKDTYHDFIICDSPRVGLIASN